MIPNSQATRDQCRNMEIAWVLHTEETWRSPVNTLTSGRVGQQSFTLLWRYGYGGMFIVRISDFIGCKRAIYESRLQKWTQYQGADLSISGRD